MEHLKHHQILHNNQYKFKQGYSAQSQLIIVIAIFYMQWTNRLNTTRHPEGIRYSTAPAAVMQAIILWYSKSSTLLDKVLAHTEKAESNRVDGLDSVWVLVKSSVPQGTVLGPL